MKKVYTRLAIILAIFFFEAVPVLAQLQPATIRQIESLLEEKKSRTPTQRKISSQLLQATREFRGMKMVKGADLIPARVDADKSGLLTVDIKATVTDALISKIKATGGLIIHSSPKYNTVRAQVKLANIENIAGYSEVLFIQPAVRAMTAGTINLQSDGQTSGLKTPAVINTSGSISGNLQNRTATNAARSVKVTQALEKYLVNQRQNNIATITSEGDHAHRADDVRNLYGFTGQGIRIGVLSDSYNAKGGAAADVANGELPGTGNPLGNTTPVTVLEDFASGNDYGRAMLQIVHDIAPKAQLFFATAVISEASFVTNVQTLRNAPYNCDIIIDDVAFGDEPVFQDGITATVVDEVSASGGLYFVGATDLGSVAKNTSCLWEGDFNDAGSPVFTGSTKIGTIHNFGTVANPVNGNIITRAGYFYTLHWADPLGASTNDYDLFLVSATGVVKAASTDIQDGTQNPFEIFEPLALVAGDRLVIFKSASAQPRALSMNTIAGRLTVFTSGQIYGHSAAKSGFCIASTPALNPAGANTHAGPFPGVFVSSNQVEIFSSDGPRRIFYHADGTAITPGNFLFGTNGGNLRNKPDFTSADGVSTAMPVSSGLKTVYGNTIAAIHAGSIVALIKSANPSLTSDQIRTILTTSALDIESPGYDNISGYGIIQAYQAMQLVNPVNLGAVTVAEGSFSNGNGTLEAGEYGNIVVQLKNPTTSPANNVMATSLTTNTPGITIIRGASAYGTIAPSGNGMNTGTPFIIAVDGSVACGTVIHFDMTVTYNGAAGPQSFMFTLPVGANGGTNISAALGAPSSSNSVFTSSTGTQTGQLNRSGIASSCAIQKTALLASTTGSRVFDAYTFTNQNVSGSCVTVTMHSANGPDLFTAVYSDSGFVPSTPNLHFLADNGLSDTLQTFSFPVAAGKAFTVVLQAVTPGAETGAAYTLNVSYDVCAAAPV
ncbi:MAG: S8 family serine peptidase, partial [Chitinophagaceae bacterium]